MTLADPVDFDAFRHWSAIVRDDRATGAFVRREIDALFGPSGSKTLAEGPWVHAIGRSPRIAFSGLFRRNETGPLDLVAAYPWTESAYTWPLSIDRIVPTSDGSQGRLCGSVGAAKIAIFDTLFFLNAARYRLGTVLPVQVSALAYALEPETLPANYAPDFTGYMPRALADRDAGYPPEEVEVHSVISAAEDVALGHVPMRRYELTLARTPAHALTLDVFTGIEPRFEVGARVAGVLFLFGFVPAPAFVSQDV